MYVADFETTTDVNDCRVWAWGLVEIGNTTNFKYGNSIDSFMEEMETLSKKNEIVFFHNIKFDGEFLLHWGFTHGFTHVENRSDITDKTMTSLISDKGVFYSIEFIFKKFKTRLHHVTFRDSLKVLPMSVDRVAKSFGLPLSKLTIDYDAPRPVGYELTPEEIEYVKHDVVIVAEALRIQHEQGLNKMTTASNALADYKEIIGKANFDRWFPTPDYDADVRQSYKGGFTYANPAFTDKVIGEGIVLDVNSLYPSVMYYKPLPYGEPIFYTGKYVPDRLYKLYVQILTCHFELKPGFIPTIQLKHSLSFMPTEYLTSSNGEDVTLCLTSVDLDLFLTHYNVYNLEWVCGWKFKGCEVLFRDYIDKWYAVKEQATIDKNPGLRQIAKLMLNGLYGKFAINPNVRNKIPVLNIDGSVGYILGEPGERKPLYIPVGTFITAWARYTTITAAQKVFDRFLYADTDSLHLIGSEPPEGLEISGTKLGAWKIESKFTRAKFIRAKTYVEEIDGELKVTCAGLPDYIHPQVTFDNFARLANYTGKLKPTHVAGGIVLTETDFTIKA